MFLRVVSDVGKPILVNTDHIYCVIQEKGRSKVVYTDNSYFWVKEDLLQIERRLKGADDE